jgi:cold shock protein
MAIGKVKWFNPTKGFGFIEPEGGDKDVFVHISAVQASGMTTLEPDQKIQYELEDGQNGKVSAGNLKVV